MLVSQTSDLQDHRLNCAERFVALVPRDAPSTCFVDLGVDESVDQNMVIQANIPCLPLPEPKEVLAIDGKFLVNVTHQNVPLTLTLSGNHRENFQPFISSPASPVVLDLPWLKRHNPNIDWSTASISIWSEYCHKNCLSSAVPPGPSMLQEPPEEIDQSNIL